MVDVSTKRTDSNTAYHIMPPPNGPEDAQQSNGSRQGRAGTATYCRRVSNLRKRMGSLSLGQLLTFFFEF